MKKIKTNIKISKKVLIITVIGVFVLGGGAFALYRNRSENRRTVSSEEQDDERGVNEVNYGPPTEEEIDETKRQKEQIIKEYEQNQNPQPSTVINVTISRANQAGGGQPLNIRTIVDGTTSGTCEVNLKKDGQATVRKTFPIGVEATYAVCQQADIPAGEFGAGGDWTLEVVAKSGNLVSAVASQKVTIIK
jgi:hypothetical protein